MLTFKIFKSNVFDLACKDANFLQQTPSIDFQFAYLHFYLCLSSPQTHLGLQFLIKSHHLLAEIGDWMHVEHRKFFFQSCLTVRVISVADHEYFSLLVCLFALFEHDDKVELPIEKPIIVLFHHVRVLPLRPFFLLD